MTAAGRLLRACASAGINFFTGVPCSYLSAAFAELENLPPQRYVPATREDLCMGLAAGSFLGGRLPAIFMQNSGLGTSLNVLQSLLQLYGIPCVLFISWRGEPGARHSDAPEHAASGDTLLDILHACKLPFAVLSADNLTTCPERAARQCRELHTPVVVLVRKGLLDESGYQAAAAPSSRSPTLAAGGLTEPFPDLSELRSEPLTAQRRVPSTKHHTGNSPAVWRVLEALATDAFVVSCNGLLSREVFAWGDRPRHFYMLGSMGLATALALGVARAQPHRRIVVLDGDANLFMGLGTLPMVGACRPPNLWHVVFDNGVHRSTGGQRSLSGHVDIAALATACGYARARTLDDLDDGVAWLPAMRDFLSERAPALLRLRCAPARPTVGRVSIAPLELAARFRAALAER